MNRGKEKKTSAPKIASVRIYNVTVEAVGQRCGGRDNPLTGRVVSRENKN